MHHPAHHPPPHHPGNAYPPPPPMYSSGGPGGPLPPPTSSMAPGPSGHPMLHAQPPPPPHAHHGLHMGRGPPLQPSQSNGIPQPPPGGPSPRIMSGAPVPPPHPEGPHMSGNVMPPPPPRSASAASQHHMHQQHPHNQSFDGPGGNGQPMNMVQKLAHSNEQAWIAIGSAAEAMEDYDRAIAAYESALRHNPYSVPAMNAIAGVHRTTDRFEKAVDYFQRVLNIVPENGETWGAMGHCYLMMDDLQKAYTAYQQALYHLPNPKEPKLWYGIGILYDRYGSLEHAEEAFASVVRMDPNYEKANEIYFRLGIIYKQQNKYQASLECFRYILNNPPRPLTEIDIWFQIGHVYEQQKEFGLAKEAYERVLAENPSHAKVLQQLGWLYHQSTAGFENQDLAIQFLTKSLESDANDAQSWYLLGRAYMAERNYNKAYEAYQQAVYRDGKNPTFWCSIGVLYYQISQYRDALDAYSRAIRLNPYISEVWFDLGSLYESCNNQISDAIDAYARAAELDPDNPHIQQRLTLLRNAEARGEQVSSAPMPQDVHPTAYANHPGQQGPPGPYGGAGLDGGPREGTYPGQHRHSQSPHDGFRDGPPPQIPNIEDAEAGRHAGQHALAPMDASRPGGQSPPSHQQMHGRTSPRAQAYGGGYHPDFERERMRGPGEGIYDRNGPGPQRGDYGRSYDGPQQHQQARQPVSYSTQGGRGGKAGNGGTPKSSRSAKGTGAVNDASPSSKRSKGKAESVTSSPRLASTGRNKRDSPPAQAPSTLPRPSNGAVPARTIDEDYDGGAADALMGLAGAASASAPLRRDSPPPQPAATQNVQSPAPTNGVHDAGEAKGVRDGEEAEETPASASVKAKDSGMTDAEKFDDIRRRAEVAAVEEERVEEQGGALQSLGKRGALSDEGDERSPEKRHRADEDGGQVVNPASEGDGEKIVADGDRVEEVNGEKEISITMNGKDEQSLNTEMNDSTGKTDLQEGQEGQGEVDAANDSAVQTAEVAEKPELDKAAAQESNPDGTAGSTTADTAADEPVKPSDATANGIANTAPESNSSAPAIEAAANPASRPQSEPEEGEVA